MMVIGKMTGRMAMARQNGQMDPGTKVNIFKGIIMAKACFYTKTGQFTKAISTITSVKVKERSLANTNKSNILVIG